MLELNGTQIGNAGGTAPVTGFMVLTDGAPNNSYSFGGAAEETGTVTTGFNIGGSNTLLLIVNNTEGACEHSIRTATQRWRSPEP